MTCNMIYTVNHALSTKNKMKSKAPLVEQDETTISISQKWNQVIDMKHCTVDELVFSVFVGFSWGQ